MRVAWLGEPASFDESLVGGKTASLGRVAASFRVPPGFCVDASAHERLGAALEGDAHARAELHELVATSYGDLAHRIGVERPRVAVRSSAIGEDSRDASFAGQYETLLNVTGAHAIVDAVLHCWRSLASERAVAYRRERGITGTPHIAVLVQQMVDPDVSAIAFSADPVSGSRDVVVVNAARGLGDAIASGEITPDTFSVRKSDLAIVDRRATADGIDDDSVRAIARLAQQLESAMGWPVDIECARQDDQLYLLQCRPITTLADPFPVTWADPEDAKLTWTREDTHFDRVLGPLAIEFVRHGPDYGIRKRGAEAGSPLIVRHEPFNGCFYASAKPRVSEAELPAEMTASTARRRALARTLRDRWDGEYLPELKADYAWMDALRVAELTRDEAADAWLELWRRIRRAWHIHFIVTGSAYPVMEELAQTYERLVGGDGADAFALTQGLAPTLQDLERGLARLTDAARGAPQVASALARPDRSLEALATLEGGRAFVEAFGAFIARHGEIGQETFDIETAAWRDEPAKLLALIAHRLRGDPDDPEIRFARVRARADEIAVKARAAVADRPAERAQLEEVIGAALSAGPLTEEHNYWIDRVSQAYAHRLAVAFGERLAREGAVANARDIFLLYVGDVAAALRSPADLRPLVAERARELARWRSLKAPKTIGAPPTAPEPVTPGISLARLDLSYTVTQDSRDVLKGVGASPGIVRGPARLIRDEADFPRMRRGDVLVCRASTVSWIPLFTMAAAVITEVGGSLSHAAVVAREFGVPAVVAAGGALSTLVDGEPLDVDGAAGIVRRRFPVSWEEPSDAEVVWRRDDAHQTGVIRPLAIEAIRNGASYGSRRRDETLGPPIRASFRAFNGRVYIGSRALRPASEMPEHHRRAIAKRRVLARHIRRDWDTRFMPELAEHFAWMRDVRVDGDSADTALAWDELWRRHRRVWTIHMLVTAASYTVMDELTATYAELVGGAGEDAIVMTQGLAPTLQRLESDLHDLAETARAAPRVARALREGADLARLRGIDPMYGSRVDVFLAAHGDAGLGGDGLGALAWADDPSPLLAAIANRLRVAPEAPSLRLRRLRDRADAIERAARERLGGRPDDLARFEEVLGAALAAGPLTEEHNYWLDRPSQANLARALRTFGRRLVRDGALGSVDDIFLLYASEAREALASPHDLAAKIAERAAEQERWKSYEAPETLGAEELGQAIAPTNVGARHLLYRAEQDDPSHVLRGAPASAGVARGPARLIRTLDEFKRFQRGDVLVCQSSNVSWIPLFTSAAAVVTQVGGPLSHAAVVAREFGIPAVVGTAIALETIVDGEQLEVDGTAGLVRRLFAPPR